VARTGGQAVAGTLARHGARRLFCVPGESVLPLLDALADGTGPRPVPCRHEGGAAFMAEAAGRLTGRPGVAVAARGPGLCNAAIAVHSALLDSTPLVLLAGLAPAGNTGRGAFQEIDAAALFGAVAKAVTVVDRADRLPEAVARAFHTAVSGRPGPVVVAAPHDVLAAPTDAVPADPVPAVRAHPDPRAMAALADRLRDAADPLLLLGGGGWDDAARAAVRDFAAAQDIPVAVGFRRHDLFPTAHPCFAGELGLAADPALVRRARAADPLIAVGTRLAAVTTQDHTVPGPPGDAPHLAHVHPVAETLGATHRPGLAVQADPAPFAEAAAALPAVVPSARAAARHDARADYETFADPEKAPEGASRALARAMRTLDAELPADAVVAVDAGNFAGWPQRYLTLGGPAPARRFLAPVSGAMGYGAPAGIAAALETPGRPVIAFCGDGGFLMNDGELATAVQENAAVVFVVVDNAQYGTIRLHQESLYPGRAVATGLTSPDFAALARAHGAAAWTVDAPGGLMTAMREALATAAPALVHLRLPRETLSVDTRLEDLAP